MSLSNVQLPFVPKIILSQHPLSDLLPLSDKPVHIDLGTGLGHFLEGMGQRHPQVNWIGLEQEGKFLKRAVRRIQRAGCENVRLFNIDGWPFLLESVAPASIDHIWLNFPDPWPKRKHHERRHTNPWMLGLLINRLKVGGELHLATDVPDYLDNMTKGLAAMVGIPLITDTPWQRATLNIETKYERKWRAQGRPLFYSDWRKTEGNLSGNLDNTTTYPYNWQAPPPLHFPQIPSPKIIDKGRYFIKMFAPSQQNPTQARFLLVDRHTGFDTSGIIGVEDGYVQLSGAWTPWKIEMVREL